MSYANAKCQWLDAHSFRSGFLDTLQTPAFSALHPSSYTFYGTPVVIISLPSQETSVRPLSLDQCHWDFFSRSLIMDFSSSPKQAIFINLGHPHASRYCSINFHFLVSFSPCSFSPLLNPNRLVKTAYVKYPHEAFFVAACFPSLTSKNAKEVAWYSRAMGN